MSFVSFVFCLIHLLSHLPNQISVLLSFVRFLLDLHSPPSFSPAFLKICKRGKNTLLFFCARGMFVYVMVEGEPSLVGKSTLLSRGHGGHPLTLRLLDVKTLRHRRSERLRCAHCHTPCHPHSNGGSMQMAARLL